MCKCVFCPFLKFHLTLPQSRAIIYRKFIGTRFFNHNHRSWFMRSSTTFPNKLIGGRILQICVVAGLCCYVALLGIIELTHDHTDHCHSEDTCLACFFCSQHVSTEIEFYALIFPFLFSATFSLYEAVFLPLSLTTNTRSRAPPVFSNKLSIVVC